MSFQPKEVWEKIKLLCKGENIHHSSTRTILMRMVSGDLSTMDGKNVWVFAGHFGKVLNDTKLTNTSVINGMNIR